jgi:probable HAF family extracellular repeat protein
MKYAPTAFLLAAAALSKAQSLTDLGTLGGNQSFARAVSAEGGIVVGNATIANNQTRAFRWSNGVMTDLGTLGGNYSYAVAVSADGSVVIGSADNANDQPRAFRWSNGVMTDIGIFGGSYSYAEAVSADGSVIVGYADNASSQNRAFRWENGIMTDLGILSGGTSSSVHDVSADGSSVIGSADDASGQPRAFRWAAGVMTNLGTLGGTYSEPRAVSTDGSVVVGYARDSNNQNRAFRWSDGVMSDLGTVGGHYSDAFALSADGSVVVGYAENASSQPRAFRWHAGVMTDLGTLPGGTYSFANAVSADGSVVVGNGDNVSNEYRAFRWTEGVMTDLGTLGGAYVEATAVSADGSAIVGYAENANGSYRAFLYRNNVMLDAQDWLGSVGGVYSMLSTSLELTRAHVEGAHHRPLAELGRGKSYWATGDITGSSRSRDLITRSGEAGMTFEPWSNVLVGIGAGYGRQDQQLLNEGSATTFGQYLIGEIDFLLADGGIVSVLVSSGDWENETDRGYVTGGGVDFSHGETDIKSTSFRFRYDTPTLTKTLGADVKAYASYGHSRARADGYVETGGSFAGSFGEMEQTAKEGRLGVAATRAFGEKFRGRLSAEWIRRFDRNQAAITATDLTSTLDFTLPGAAVQRDQARFGFDLDYLMDAKTTLSFTVHAAGRGEVADVSGAISLRKAF